MSPELLRFITAFEDVKTMELPNNPDGEPPPKTTSDFPDDKKVFAGNW